MGSKSLARMRVQYHGKEFSKSNSADDPFEQFKLWFAEVESSGDKLANAMTLSTVSAEKRPSSRIVLLKKIDRGFVFYTHLTSQKGRELAANSSACLSFFWPAFHRQVKISGDGEVLSRAEVEAYFASRPRGSQLSAAISPQSEIVESRQKLIEARSKLANELGGDEVACPDNWGGYRVIPHAFEFWQGQDDRLHDRVYYRKADSFWTKERLAP